MPTRATTRSRPQAVSGAALASPSAPSTRSGNPPRTRRGISSSSVARAAILAVRVALLAPGVALHELAHHILCVLSGVRVHQVVYFRLGSPAGYVVHEEPIFYRQIFAIVAGPFFLNSAASVVLLNLALRAWAQAEDTLGFGLAAVLTWLGISVGLQAIPSRADARNLYNSSNRHLFQLNPFALVGYPVSLAIYLVQIAKPLGSEWYYTVLLAYLAERGFIGAG